MSVLTFVYKNGLWLSWPLFCLGVLLLWFFITTAVKLGDRHRICSLPLQPEQVVEFPAAGKVILWLEGPQLTSRFRDLTFELTGSDGATVPGRGVLFRTRSSSLSRVRISDRIFQVPHAGGYALHTRGLGETRDGDAQHRLVFMRPYQVQVIGAVLGIVLGALLVIGSVVNFCLRYFQGAGSS